MQRVDRRGEERSDLYYGGTHVRYIYYIVHDCQEIGLVTLMFFFELLFSYVSSQFPSMFPLLTYSQSCFSLSADYPRHSR